MTKEENFELLQQAIEACTEEGTDRQAVVVLIDNDTQKVRIYGLNVEGEDVPQLLVDVAEEIFDKTAMAAVRRSFDA